MRICRPIAAALAGAALFAAPPAMAAEEEIKLTIAFSAPPEIDRDVDLETGEENFFGTVSGTVADDGAALLAGASVDCQFDGYTYEARSFSCGFIDAESVSGVCLFTVETGDSAVAEWHCQTGATMTSDARCEGAVRWVEGTGAFAGIAGEARFHSDLFLFPTRGVALWKGRWGVPRLAALTH